MQGFLHCVWSRRMPYSAAEDGGEKKKKKSASQAHRGSRQGTGCPNNRNFKCYTIYHVYYDLINLHIKETMVQKKAN